MNRSTCPTGFSSASVRAVTLLLLVLLAACAQVGKATDLNPDRFAPWQDAVEEYRLRPGDQIEVKLTYNPELSDRVLIGPDGRIALTLVGIVQAEGKTADELAKELTQRFSKELRNPDVVVILREYSQRSVLVGGEVAQPGVHPLVGHIGVLEGILMAGGLKDTADAQEVALIRRGPDHRPMLRVVDVKSILTGGPNANDVPLHADDVIYVPRSNIAEVDLWIDQYVNQLLPFTRSFNYTINKNLAPGTVF
jgi:polysaccharide biosynthesis/export protein PslD